MTAPVFREVAGSPGLYSASGLTEDPDNPGLYLVPDGMTETSPGSGLYQVETIGATAPVLEAFTDADPSPRVKVTFDVLDDSIDTITVYRIADGETITVANATRRFAAGGFQVTDYEAPLGVVLTYRAQQYDADGAELGYTDAASVTVTQSDVSLAWISDPLDPASAVQVELRGDFGDTLTDSSPTQTYLAGGRTVALYGPPGLLSGVNLSVQTKTLADADTLRTILRRTLTLVRTAPPTRLPRYFLCVVPQRNEVDQTVQWGGGWVTWDLTAAQVSPRVLDLVQPIVTWQDYKDAYATWADMKAAYLTWLDAIKNPPQGG